MKHIQLGFVVLQPPSLRRRLTRHDPDAVPARGEMYVVQSGMILAMDGHNLCDVRLLLEQDRRLVSKVPACVPVLVWNPITVAAAFRPIVENLALRVGLAVRVVAQLDKPSAGSPLPLGSTETLDEGITSVRLPIEAQSALLILI